MATPNEELLKAIDTLEAYAAMASRDVSRFEEVKEAIQLLFFSEYRKEKEVKDRTVKKELIKSVGLIKKYLPLIEKYSHGSPEEQNLAENFNQTIQRYNDAIKSESSEEDKIRLTIDISHRIAYQKAGSKESAKVQKIFEAKKQPLKSPSQLETDTLKMKAIRLIEDDPDFQEALLETLKDKDAVNSEEIETDGKMVTLMQTWSALPGEVHRIVGAFRREQERSIPVKDSFKVFLESKQTGHPFPAQHMGWALSHWLVPSSPLWIDSIPLLFPLLERKKKMAKSLLPKGDKNIKARALYRLKKEIFNDGRLEMLTYHQELAHAIALRAPGSDETTAHEIINAFYEALLREPFPFQILCQVYEEINNVFIDAPFESVEEKRLEGVNEGLFPLFDHEKEIFHSVWEKTTVEKTAFDKVKKRYLNFMGPLIGSGASLLLKLQLSEKVGARPPPLSDFELKLQAAALKHLIDFLDEMEEDVPLQDEHEPAALKLRMKMAIQSEIELFSAPTFEDIDPFLQEVTEEIVSYFHARYHAQE